MENRCEISTHECQGKRLACQVLFHSTVPTEKLCSLLMCPLWDNLVKFALACNTGKKKEKEWIGDRYTILVIWNKC